MQHSFKIPLLLISTISLSCAQSIKTQPMALRASYEDIKISSNEDMGLLGMSYLFEETNHLYYGFSLYSAISGQRGGFFVGGFNLGYKYPLLPNLYLDLGVFGGGGGGGSAPQGGGLMVKEYLGGLYQFDNYSFGVNYSNVTFPNGDIKSDQFSFVADVKFDTTFADSPLNKKELSSYNFSNNKDYLVATYQLYFPKSGTLKTDNTALDQTIKLIGIEYGMDLKNNFIAYAESAAAMGGDSAGYMEVLGGFGYKQKLFSSNYNVQAKLSLGAAGGGKVKTNGGGVSKGTIGFNYSSNNHINAGISVGYYHALENNFDANFAKVNLGINTNFLSVSQKGNYTDYDAIDIQKFNLRVSNLTYLYSDNITPKKNGLNIQLIGFKLDYLFSDHLYVSGQAYGAYKGDAGGYAVGMFGLGYVQPIVYDFSAFAECAFGAAGGGSLQSGGGNVVQPSIGLQYALNNKLSLEASLGRVKALNGDMDTNTIEAGLVYKFNKLIAK